MRVLVTGGAGYIGSHTVRALQNAGHQPVVLDNLVYGHQDIVTNVLQIPLIIGQVGDREVLTNLLCGRHPGLEGTPHEGKPIQAVLHFAAYAYVGESIYDPAKYYRNNLGDTLTLLETLVAHQNPIPIVFSSTCATYGPPQQVPITEDHPQLPINPYGWSKLMVEQLLRDFARAYALPCVILRYFNASGADPAGDIGEDHTPETHLIPRVLDAMSGREPFLQIFGDDYPTPDGTCIRDYIHVCDLADAHVLGLQKIISMSEQSGALTAPLVYNLGNGTGYSVKEVIESAQRVTGKTLTTQVADRRPGDPSELVASAVKAQSELNWQPKYPDISTIIEHAWRWHQQRHCL